MSQLLPSSSPPRGLSGLARLYGDVAFAKFQTAHVCVVGVGGVGSWAAEALARSGIGALTLIDLDNISESNTNRQLHALEGNFGKAKVEAMRERLQLINSQLKIDCVEDFVTPENVADLITQKFDAVLDCIDQVNAKAALIAHCKAQQIEIITTGAAGGKTDSTKIVCDDLARNQNDPLLASVRYTLRKEYGFTKGDEKKIAAKKFGVNAVYCTQNMLSVNSGGLACSGYGSAMHMTAGIGLAAVGAVLQHLAQE